MAMPRSCALKLVVHMMLGDHCAHDSFVVTEIPSWSRLSICAVRWKVALKESPLSFVTPGLFPVELSSVSAAGSRGRPVAYMGRRKGGHKGFCTVFRESHCCLVSRGVV